MKKPKIYTLNFAQIYELYLAKAKRKNRTKDEVDTIIYWLTGYDSAALKRQLEKNIDMETFFSEAPLLNPKRLTVKGVICKVRVEDIEDPMTRNIRCLDKLIDELAKGKTMNQILRD